MPLAIESEEALVAAPVLGLERVGRFLRLAMGLTAWKVFEGNRWSLRANPSSGNLHPTECYVVLSGASSIPGSPSGVLHYAPREHLLEQRCALQADAAERLAALLPAGGFLVALSSIHWREAWKYGERAFRYCALDLGHAIGAIDYAAASVGMRSVPLAAPRDADLAQLLGLDRDTDFADLDPWDREHPEWVVAVVPEDSPESVSVDWEALRSLLAGGTWAGRANALSSEHHEWDVIPAVAAATPRDVLEDLDESAREVSELPSSPPRSPAELVPLILERRSAVSMRAAEPMPLADFAAMLDATLPRPTCAPWRGWTEASPAALALFVHRVAELESGLYLFLRDPRQEAALRAALSPDFVWSAPSDQVPGLFLLRTGRAEGAARTISCGQDIAADGAFSLGMLVPFHAPIEADPSVYRRLFWECGLIGQALYLEAGAHGVSATGIGCYFDDSMHALLGLADDTWQVMYHFTVGQPTVDERLGTEPPYAHLSR